MHSKDEPTKPLQGAAALMQWLGEHAPHVQQKARSFPGDYAFHSYMCELAGIDPNRFFDSHSEACMAYLEAFKKVYTKIVEANSDGLSDALSEQAKHLKGEDCNAAMIARDGPANEYRARAFRDGKWLPWHSITRQVYENRQRWPRDGYEVQAAPFVDDTAPSSIKPPIAGLTFLGPVTHQLGSAGKE